MAKVDEVVRVLLADGRSLWLDPEDAVDMANALLESGIVPEG